MFSIYLQVSIFLQPKQEKAGTKNLEEYLLPKKAKVQLKQPKHNQWLEQISIKNDIDSCCVVVGQTSGIYQNVIHIFWLKVK